VVGNIGLLAVGIVSLSLGVELVLLVAALQTPMLAQDLKFLQPLHHLIVAPGVVDGEVLLGDVVALPPAKFALLDGGREAVPAAHDAASLGFVGCGAGGGGSLSLLLRLRFRPRGAMKVG